MTTTASTETKPPLTSRVTATVQVLPLDPGVYAFGVDTLDGDRQELDGMLLPALLLSAAPGRDGTGTVEVLAGTNGRAGWLLDIGDTLVVRVDGAGRLLLTSYRATTPGSATLSVQARRLESGAQAPSTPQFDTTVRLRFRGDVSFVGDVWAGGIGQGHWIEGFTVTPQGTMTAEEIEYSAIDADGTILPWVPGGTFCSSPQPTTPLTAFAVRLQGAAKARYRCRYEAAIVGGGVAGPAEDGEMCRADAAIEAIRIRLIPRTAPSP